MGPTLSGIELRTRLHEDSIRDPLTRLYNRRFLDECLRREIMRARRMESTLSVIMLDLDKFKHVSDEYGHDVGDQVLVVLAKQLSQVVREEDIIGEKDEFPPFPDALPIVAFDLQNKTTSHFLDRSVAAVGLRKLLVKQQAAESLEFADN